MTAPLALTGARIFNGESFHDDHALVVNGTRVVAVQPLDDLPDDIRRLPLDGGLISPGFIDLQVNGGGGVLFNNDPSEEGIRRICAAHARFGTTAMLPTLITDEPDIMAWAMEAGAAALANRAPGYLGLHLEGPHLSTTRKGTHAAELIRPMEEADLDMLVREASRIGRALITLAPESVTTAQVRTLHAAGYRVSLGHSDATCDTALRYADAGATVVTHLYNAMSPLTHREPGMVGAALSSGQLHCGLIADGFHVDPVAMGIALRAKRGPAHIFLVTDAMSTIGTDDTSLQLNGRLIRREGGRLTLADGTLAGADIDMASSVRYVHETLGLPLAEALRMATIYPAEAIGATNKGRLDTGFDADFVLLSPQMTVEATWIAGACVYQA